MLSIKMNSKFILYRILDIVDTPLKLFFEVYIKKCIKYSHVCIKFWIFSKETPKKSYFYYKNYTEFENKEINAIQRGAKKTHVIPFLKGCR